ncbi:MAG: VCBS repeat-containing protein [Planctomycetes bacterium]|nr:VCBS repeat-containing protein [Planctomycetota bacterium]
MASCIRRNAASQAAASPTDASVHCPAGPNNPNATPGVHVFFSPEDPATGEWIYSRIESEAGMNSCVGGDMNQDGRPDLVCTGRGGVIRWYENLGS